MYSILLNSHRSPADVVLVKAIDRGVICRHAFHLGSHPVFVSRTWWEELLPQFDSSFISWTQFYGLLLSCVMYNCVSFPPIKSTRTSPSLLCFQVFGVEPRMERHLLNRANLQKECHRLALPGQVHLLRMSSPVRYVPQFWETFHIWLKSKEILIIVDRKHTHVGHAGNNSFSLQTFNSTRYSTLDRNPSSLVWGAPHFWRAAWYMQEKISLPTWR